MFLPKLKSHRVLENILTCLSVATLVLHSCSSSPVSTPTSDYDLEVAVRWFDEARMRGLERCDLALLAVESSDVAGDAKIPLALACGSEPHKHAITAIPERVGSDGLVSRRTDLGPRLY